MFLFGLLIVFAIIYCSLKYHDRVAAKRTIRSVPEPRPDFYENTFPAGAYFDRVDAWCELHRPIRARYEYHVIEEWLSLVSSDEYDTLCRRAYSTERKLSTFTI